MADKAPVKAMPKTEIYKKLAAETELEPKQIAAVFAALEALAKEELSRKNGAKEFLVPGLIKLKLKHKPATKARVAMVAGREVEVKAKAASGDIHAGVRQGTAAWLDVHTVSGRVASSLDAASAPADDDRTVRLHLSTVSGDIALARV